MNKSGKVRCSACRMDHKLCICRFLPFLDRLSLPITMIFHSKEWPKPTNTGHFIEKILPNVRRCVYHGGDSYRSFCAEVAGKSAGERPILIFPDYDSPVLDRGDRELIFKNGLVFLDGTWNQAQRMLHCSKEISLLPKRRLSPPQRKAMLWEEHLQDGMATYEAVAWALSEFYSEQEMDAFWHIIKVRTQRIEWLRGLLPAAQVDGGIPPEALETRNLANN